MARAREIADLDCNDSYALAAAKVVEVRAGELFEHSNGVLDTSDIEAVHDMRVASRRLRAAIEIFEPCFPRKRIRRALKDVKALADALGERRDRDVSIAFLADFSEHVTAPDRRGIQMLSDQLRDEQDEANDALAPFVAEDRLALLRRSIAQLCAAARESARAEKEEADRHRAPSGPEDGAKAPAESGRIPGAAR
jgi:CHAD domain-containing protein